MKSTPRLSVVTGASSGIGLAIAQAVAAAGVRGMLAGKPEVIPGFLNWLTAQIVQVGPRALSERIAGKFFR